jgi:RNA polymerase sigma-70 factor (ECF subfamily)
MEEINRLQEDNSEENNPEVSENLKRALESAISQLSAKYRVVFILREIEQVSVADTATMLGISEENVKIRLHRAKNMLKEMLTSEVNAIDLFPFHAPRCSRVAVNVMNHINSQLINPFGNIV